MKKLLTLIVLAGTTAVPLAVLACGDDGPPTRIKVPGQAAYGLVRGDHLLTHNGKDIIIVDLKHGRTFDLGELNGRSWHTGDVADGQALVYAKDRLQVIALATGKVVNEIPTPQPRAFGFAGKGKVFIHRGTAVDIVEIAGVKKLHTIELGKEQWPFSNAWQKVGNRLFVTGEATSVCVIDLDTGKLTDRFYVESRLGIAAMQVEGSFIYCIGSQSTWAARFDHVTCFDIETKKTFLVDLPKGGRLSSRTRFASGPFGTAYLMVGNHIERITMFGDVCGTFTVPGEDPVLGIWRGRAVVAGKDEIRMVEIAETPAPVTRK
jgi:hypothetical protein